MNIRIQQLNPTVGDITGNKNSILNALKKAEEDSIELLILPEMVLTGYPPMDLLERQSFVEDAFRAVDEIILATSTTAILFGSPMPNKEKKGRFIYNSAILAFNHEKLAEIHKTLLPTYDVFDEARYFEPNRQFNVVEFKGVKFGITICEDIWYNDNEKQYVIYRKQPAMELKKAGAEVIVNISASPFTKNKYDYRRMMLRENVRRIQLPVLYANQCGANTELIFDGDSMAMDAEGNIIAHATQFKPDSIDVEYNKDGDVINRSGANKARPIDINERIFKALVTGLKDYMGKTGVSGRVVLGLSGGIDSALTAVIACEALGAESVLGITMPSQFSSDGSVSDSEILAQNLGMKIKKIAIETIYNSYIKKLNPLFKETHFGIAEENIQSRARGMLLMAVSNKFGHMLLATGNKSEMAVGYNTLYGDLAGGLAVIADVYKTEVYTLANWLNKHYYGKEIIPESIINKPPSAELKPDQQDSDTLPSYEKLDAILKFYLEDQLSLADIKSKGYPKKMIEKVIKMVNQSEFKRSQSPPVLKITQKAFGSGRRIPIVKKG